MLAPAVKERAAKFDYEFMGATLPEISQRYGFAIDLLEYLEQSWVRKVPVSPPLPKPTNTDLAVSATALKELSQHRMQLVGLYRQMEQEPLIAHLERCILEKALEIVEELESRDDRTPRKLNDLLTAIRSIQSRDPVQVGQTNKEPANAGVVVQIQNNLN